MAVALLAVAAGCGGDEQVTLKGVVREPALDVGAVELPAADGEPRAMRAEEGGLLVTNFGYTFCPDICPTTMSDISVAVHALPPELADRVTVAFVTVDPERDTVEVLEGYLGSFFEGARVHRTEDPEALTAAADAFGVQFEVADHEPGATAYEVSHSAVTFVIDDQGTVVVEWPFGFENTSMASDLRTLLTKETTT